MDKQTTHGMDVDTARRYIQMRRVNNDRLTHIEHLAEVLAWTSHIPDEVIEVNPTTLAHIGKCILDSITSIHEELDEFAPISPITLEVEDEQ